MRAIVTGGGGFLGRFIARRLKEEGYEVTVIGRNFYPFLEKEGIKSVKQDICDKKGLIERFKGFDEVYHCASLTGISVLPELFYRINVEGTANVIYACKANNIKKLIYTSSPSVVYAGKDEELIDETAPYPEKFLAPYPYTKAIAEQMVLTANSETFYTVALRPHLIFGQEDTNLIPRLLEKARKGRLVQVGEGNNIVDLTYVKNAADAHVLCGKLLAKNSRINGKAYFITNNEPVNLWDFINRILKGSGLPQVEKKISLKKAYIIGYVFEILYKVLKLETEPPLTRFLALMLGTSHYYSIENARRDFGYTPVVSMDKALSKTLKYIHTSMK